MIGDRFTVVILLNIYTNYNYIQVNVRATYVSIYYDMLQYDLITMRVVVNT